MTSAPRYMGHAFPQVFMACAREKHRGVLIGFRRSVFFTLQSEIKDPEGRYLILIGHLQDTEVMIVSNYTPNDSPALFLSHLLQEVAHHARGAIIVCGYSNLAINPYLDKSPPSLLPRASNKCLHTLLCPQRSYRSYIYTQYATSLPTRCQKYTPYPGPTTAR